MITGSNCNAYLLDKEDVKKEQLSKWQGCNHSQKGAHCLQHNQ